MKSNRKMLPAIAGVVLGLSLFATPVFAAVGDGNTGETEATITFEAGDLKLISVPEIDFGTRQISANDEDYAAQSVTPVIRVSDLRGSGTGWDLTATLSAFTNTETNAETLNSATITITSPSVDAVNNNLSAQPTTPATVELTADGTTVPVLTAAEGQGMGVWDLTWQAQNTKLNVKAGTAQQGENVATLDWSLEATP